MMSIPTTGGIGVTSAAAATRVRTGNAQQINIVLNWFDDLLERAPLP